MAPSAISNLPGRSRVAPVKDPLAWPKSSLSAIDSGSAAQLTWIKASSPREDAAWSCWATSSLPTPVSPRIRTGRSLRATTSISSRSRRAAGDRPRIWVPEALRCRSRATASLWCAVRSRASMRAVVRSAAPARAPRASSHRGSTASKAWGATASAVIAPTTSPPSVRATAQAGVDVLGGVGIRGQLPVERIGKRGVGREPHRAVPGEDELQPGVLAPRIAADQRLVGQAVAGQGHQLVPVQPEEAGRIAGEHAPDGVQEPLVAVLRGQGRGQVPGDLQEDATCPL